jgi:ribosomal-protein-alanine N-acetyltransferase
LEKTEKGIMLKIEGERVYLRDHQAHDLEVFHSWLSDPVVMKYLPWRTSSIDDSFLQLAECLRENAKEDRRKYYFAVILKGNEQIIGEAGFTIEKNEISGGIANMGYFLLKKYWGNGYATEVGQMMIGYCFTTLKLHKVTAGCDAENSASEGVMKKSGMKREGYREKQYCLDGEWRDRIEYGILYQDWVQG